MKLLVCLLTAILLTSCNSFQIQRRVVDNEFYSSRPQIAVKIGDSFVLEEKSKERVAEPGMDIIFDITLNHFVFVDRKERKVVVIGIEQLAEGYFENFIGLGIDSPLERGSISQSDQKYPFIIGTVSNDDSCMLVKRYAKVSGADDSTFQSIQYMQEITPNLGKCDDWSNPYQLNDEQKAFLAKFKTNSDKDIQFIPYKEAS